MCFAKINKHSTCYAFRLKPLQTPLCFIMNHCPLVLPDNEKKKERGKTGRVEVRLKGRRIYWKKNPLWQR